MSRRSEKTLLADILDAITQIETYIVGLDVDAFSKDRKTQDAVVRNLEIIGEASSRLPDDFRSGHSDIPWALNARLEKPHCACLFRSGSSIGLGSRCG